MTTSPRELSPSSSRLLRLLTSPISLIAIVWLGALLFYLQQLPNPDSAWYLVATDKFVRGAVLYRDIIEVNPPLAFYLHVPPVVMAQFTGWSAESCFFVYLLILIAASLCLQWHLLRRTLGISRFTCDGMLLASFVALVFLPVHVFGEREHLFVILSVPYLFLAAARIKNLHCHPILAGAIGVLAAVGFGIKPHFLIAMVFVELFIATSRRSWRSMFRYETWTCGILLVGYLLVTALLHPEYLEFIVPMAMEVYNAYGRPPLRIFIDPTNYLLGVVPLLAVYIGSRTKLADSLAQILGIAAAGSLISFLIQAKGWQYHLLPAATMGMLAVSSMILTFVETPAHIHTRPKVPFALSIAALTMLLANPLSYHIHARMYSNLLLPVVRSLGAESMMAFTVDLAVGFPLANATDIKWQSRFPCLWPLFGALRFLTAETPPTQERVKVLRDILDYTVNAVIEDLERFPPDLIIVDRARPYLPRFGIRDVDYIKIFSRDARFVSIWRCYKKVDEILYERHDIDRQLDIWRRSRSSSCQNDASPSTASALYPVVLVPIQSFSRVDVRSVT